ncbi:hypothetical protein [Pseudomonas viridiflava]|uniref:hypothetical protein n=1 Tax=Pseudomonas syringae group TaxID=136849 RepID=UPI0013CF2F6F|nr:hypothetical protein [Pseudomonas viridiflava]
MNNHKNAISNDLSKLIENKNTLKQIFRSSFESEGFQFHKPEPLVSKCDKSTLFIGSTISTFKRYLIGRSETLADFYTIQNCLRTHNSIHIGAAESTPKWSSFFASVGAVCPSGRMEPLFNAALEFVKLSCSCSNAEFKINISKSDTDLIDILRNIGAGDYLDLDTHELAYYRHTFGMQGIWGRNCNFSVSYSGSDFMDIGNLIIIEEAQRKIAAEAAFGLETVSSRLKGYDSSIYALDIASGFTNFTKEALYIIDAIAACISILSFGIRPIADNKGRVLRRYLQGISTLRSKAQISLPRILEAAKAFEARNYNTNIACQYMASYLENYELLSATIEGSELNAAMSSFV